MIYAYLLVALMRNCFLALCCFCLCLFDAKITKQVLKLVYINRKIIDFSNLSSPRCWVHKLRTNLLYTFLKNW